MILLKRKKFVAVLSRSTQIQPRAKKNGIEAWLLQTVHVWQVAKKKALIIKKLVLRWGGPI